MNPWSKGKRHDLFPLDRPAMTGHGGFFPVSGWIVGRWRRGRSTFRSFPVVTDTGFISLSKIVLIIRTASCFWKRTAPGKQ
jgi:hypothetical protein